MTVKHTPRLPGSAALLLPLILGACMVGPDYVKPESRLAPFHNKVTAPVLRVAASPQALDTWWTGFNDPMLVTVVRRALDQNLDLAAAYARVQQARAAAGGARAQLLPTADLGASVTANKASLRSPTG